MAITLGPDAEREWLWSKMYPSATGFNVFGGRAEPSTPKTSSLSHAEFEARAIAGGAIPLPSGELVSRQDEFGNPLPPAQLDKAGAVIPTPPPPRSNMNTVGQAFNRMAGDKQKATVPREITFGRFTFRGGRIFGFDGREIPRAKAGLTVGEAQALQESSVPMPAGRPTGGQAAGGGGVGGGGGMGGGGGGGTGAGPRIGGTSANVSASGGGAMFGGGLSQIQNPLIREAARIMEFNQWMYGTQYSPSEQQQMDANARVLAESQAFQDFAKTRTPSYAVGDPITAARVRGEWSAQKEGEQKAAQQAFMRASGQIPNTQQFRQRYGQEYSQVRGY